MKKIITIGRELGSGGRTIGKMVANRQTLPLSERIYEAQNEVIAKYANQGKCVKIICNMAEEI